MSKHFSDSTSPSRLAMALMATLFCVDAAHAGTTVHYGPVVGMGNGTMRTYLAVNAADEPVELGVVMDRSTLDGLPAEPNAAGRCFDLNGNGGIDGHSECEGDYEYVLAFPANVADRADVPFQWITLNWNVRGHAPPGIYDLPHIDFHFYIANEASVRAIKLGSCGFFIDCKDFERASQPVPAKYVDARHVSVGAAVGAMGNHLVDTASPELGKPPKKFAHTFIFGAYDGRITFYEPMITREYLLSNPVKCMPIKQPAAWQVSGYYPTRYCIRYHEKADKYTVSLEGLEMRKAS
ncbi:MAG: hypothetical protein R3286_05625 [Gammaproteobacteria bacterium]|nr:hypothetical protein [Gammaproteobacteria bacterium]